MTLAAAEEKQTVDPSSMVKATPQENKKPALLSAPRVSTDTDARNPRTNAEGAAIGVSSKSGKSAIYVETDRSRTYPPR